MNEKKWIVSSSPHVRSSFKTNRIMADVVIALIPAAAYGIVLFGLNAGIVMLVSVASAVGFEALINLIFKKPLSIFDGSAVVTGMLLGMCCPPEAPFWIPMAGAFFAIAVVKLPFGGLGHNFLNPALAGRAFLLASWPQIMTTWQFPETADAVASATATTQATALEAMAYGTPPTYSELLIGNIAGCIGEVCKIGLLIGAAYLFIRKIIDVFAPLGFLGSLFLLTWAFGGSEGLMSGDGLYAILSGGAILGAFFMCTDYATSPVTRRGQLIMGIGAGAITFLIRAFGNYPEGVTYGILFMNVCTPLIDRFVRPKVYGEVKGNA